MPPLSILDLAFVPEGGTPADALRNTLDLAQHTEKWGYRRFWLAEHIRDSRIGGGKQEIRDPTTGMGQPERTRTTIT